MSFRWKSIETAPDEPEVLHYRGLWVWTTNYEGKSPELPEVNYV